MENKLEMNRTEITRVVIVARYFFISLLLVLFYNSGVGYAQNSFVLRGKVLDEHTGEALIGANVRLTNASGRELAGSSTDIYGAFTLLHLPAGSHSLRISYIGYKEYIGSVSIPSDQKEVDIRLSEDSKQLSTVVIESRSADMTMKGDTLVFNANAYRMGSGASLEDLIKRLPGAQIDESGSIVINGKTIQKIMVDGKEFLLGDTKAATKNLPAEVIDKIEMLDRSTDAARMSGFDDGEEETLLNLSFKPQYKQGLFGNAFVGYGTRNRFEANATLNNFSGANRLTLIAGGNNTNSKGMSDIAAERERSGRPRGRTPQGVATSATTAIDIARALHKNVEVEGNARYGYSDKVIQAENAIEYIRPRGNNTFAKEGADHRTQEHGIGTNLRFTYKPDSKTEVLFQPNFFWGNSAEQSNEETRTFDALHKELSQAEVNSYAKGNSLEAGGTLDVSRKLSEEGRVVSLQLHTNYTHTGREGTYTSSFINNLDASLNRTLRLQQNDLTHRTNYSMRFSYVEPLGRSFFLKGDVAWKNDRRQGVREVYTPDSDGQFTHFEEQYATSFVNTLSGYNAGLHLQKRAKLYDITIGLGIEPIEMKTDFPMGRLASIEKKEFNLSPKVTLTLRPNKQTTWRLNYQADTDMPDVYKMMPVTDPTNLLQITEGNSNLAPSLTHRVRSSFRTYNPQTKVAFNLFTRASYTLNDVASSVSFDATSGQQTIRFRNVDGNASWRMFIISSMPFFTPLVTLNLGGRVSFAHQKGFIEERENVANTWTFAPLMQLSYARGAFYARFNASSEYMGTTNTIDQKKRNTWRYQMGADASVDLIWGAKLESDITFRTRSGYEALYNQNEWLWNTALSYTFLNKKATLRLKAYDLLGSETGIARSATALNVVDSRTNVLGRYVMLHFIYRFSNFSKGSSQSDFQSFETRGRGH